MMQLDQAFQGKKCARCRQALQSDPAFDDDLWYHRACLEEGKKSAATRPRTCRPLRLGAWGLPHLGGVTMPRSVSAADGAL